MVWGAHQDLTDLIEIFCRGEVFSISCEATGNLYFISRNRKNPIPSGTPKLIVHL